MPDCTRCGTQTNNSALQGGGVDGKTGPLDDYQDSNGIVWLCDSCREELHEFLDDDPSEEGEFLTSLAGSVEWAEVRESGIHPGLFVELQPDHVLRDALGDDELREVVPESPLTIDVHMVEGDG